ncbi:MAG TPA: TIGR01458 family HAD-type hydrolase [Methanoregula sp.]|nr:TIGR01458 family HAD-type hydrolase [Methanoregula sp.]
MKDIKGVLIDLDGVMYVGNEPVPGAKDAIDFLTGCGCSFRFVSNTTRKSRKTIAGRLVAMGLEIPERYIFTPPLAAAAYIGRAGKHRCYCLIAGDAGCDLDQARPGPALEGADFVVIGDAGEKITYGSMNTAFRYVIGGAEIIALEKDRYWMAADGLSLSAGPFAAALEYATGKTATVVGKPSEEFFRLALDDMGLTPPDVIMVGDDIATDIAGAQALGIRGILVRTGKFREESLREATVKPSGIIGSIRDLPHLIGYQAGTGLPRSGGP